VFLKEQIRRGDLSPFELVEVVSAITQFSLGRMGFSGLMLSAAQLMRGVSEQDYIAFGEELYEQQIARKIYPESRALVEAHLARGHTVAVVSSATPYQAEPVSRDLGIEHIICSRYEVKDGEFTGGIVRPLCFGEGKVLAAESLAEEHGVDLEQSFFYTDSDDDIELLERVGHPQPLNPNSKLTEIAERRGWPVRRFKSRGQPHLTDYLRSVAATVSLLPSALAGLPIWALTGSVSAARNFSTSLFADLSSALIGLKLVVRGEHNAWSHRPAVFVFNHQSKADVIIIAKLLRRDLASVGKKEIKNTPLIGTTMELAGMVFIDRASSASAIEAMQPLVDAMRHQDKSVVIAPEGTRTITPKLGPFKKGPFHLAIQAGVPVVPIVIHNAGDVAPKGDFVFRQATVEVDVLPPVDTRNWRTETIDEHMAEVRSLFLHTLGQDEDPGHSLSKPDEPKKAGSSKKVVRIDRAAIAASPDEKATVQEAAARKTAVEATSIKKATVKKAPVKKATVKKATVKKATVKKATVKKATVKKAPVKKAPVKKAPVKKAAVKKATVKKAAIKKTTVRKATVRKDPVAKTSAGEGIRKKAFRKKVGVKKAGVINTRKSRARTSS